MADHSNDPGFEENIDELRRTFLKTTSVLLGGAGAVCALTPFISALLPSVQSQAEAAPVEVDLSFLLPGSIITVEWRGKPVWILRRTPEMIADLKVQNTKLRDPSSLVDQQPSYAQNVLRSRTPEYLVLVGVCTHLGCTPKLVKAGDVSGVTASGGFYCPCHGSRFDLAGRVFKGVPAPINLEVPPYYFADNHTLIIGADSKADALYEST